MKKLVIRPDSLLGRLLPKLPRLLLAVVLIALLSQALFFVAQRFFPEMTVAEWGVIEHGHWLKFLVLREEKVIYPVTNGKVKILAEDGALVRIGAPLAEVVTPSLARRLDGQWNIVLPLISQRLDEIDKKLTAIDRDLQYLDRQLTRMKPGVDQAGTLLAVEDLENQKKQLSMAKAEILRESETVAPGWRDDYQLILAEESGVFLRDLDGGEGIGFEVLQEQKDPFACNFSRTTEPVKPIGKIITGKRQWLVCRITKELREAALEEGVNCFLLLGADESAVTYVGAGISDSDFFLIFEDRSLAPELLQKRVFEGYLVFKKTSGVRIPRTALRFPEEVGGKAYTVAYGRKKKVEVEVVDENHEWAVVKGLSIGTPIYY